MAEAVFKLRVSLEPEAGSYGIPQAEPWNGEGLAGAVVKADGERQYTLTVAYPANRPDAGIAKDGFQDFARPETVEKAAWNYLAKSPNVGLWHQDGTDGAGRVVESYIYRGPDWQIDGSEYVVKSGDWLVGIQWNDEAWQDIKDGKIGGVSMQGIAKRQVADPADLIGLRS